MENKIEARHLNLYYGQKHALKDVSLDIKENKITAFIGPSGCGKSTFLKTLNRMNDYVDNVKIEGDVILDPFAGSGTTGEAALKNGRNFIGFENNPKFYDTSVRRIDSMQLLC